MVSFRRRKKSLAMEEKKVSGEPQFGKNPDGEEIKVTDRRRISLDGERQASDAGEAEEPRLKPVYVEELEARTKAAENKVQDIQSRFEQLKSQLQRETDETRQRLNKAADERARREKVDFISSLLPVADNLNRAIAAAESGGSLDVLLNGVKGTAAGFENALTSAGVEAVPSVGAQFDPELHEAVDTIEVEPERDGIVTSEYSRGYKIGDRLIKPARVQVGRSKEGVRQRAAE
jgi:molecular chaperone GrpE